MLVQDFLAISSEVSGYLHEQIQKRHVSIDTAAPATPMSTTAPTITAASTKVQINSTNAGDLKKLYPYPSPRPKATLDHEVKVMSLLDAGSEVNIMPHCVFEQLNLAIDSDINWRIEVYDSKTNRNFDDHGLIGVCHDISVDIGGVDVEQHIFMVEHSNYDFIFSHL